LVRLVKEGLRGVPDRGTGYGVLRHLHRDPTLNDQDLPPVLFNYLGKGLAGTPRVLVPISGAMETSKSPNNQRLHLLEIVAAVERDTLKVDWHFSTDLHERSTMERVADSFTAELRHLIDHCTTAGTGGFTPSDFPDAGLDQEELDKFLEDL
jgi:non-ribosomal peptide synthase protein (TIGR01720 family)